ncbi:DUF2975 domain-containing protein [Amphibacillus jilinensis]|uniref:DUF2975 domain-containing protein n=1 Tax=Amphibacillus jilinensis TaxID=1216008 RepID=UPI000300F6F2|nr:DUF2975 domain-containing protein [Amphibacillus jilinensis]
MEQSLRSMQQTTNRVLQVLNFVLAGGCLFFLIVFVMLVWASFLPGDSFSIEQGIEQWALNANLTENGTSFFSTVSFRHLPSLPEHRINVKAAFLVQLFFNLLIYLSLFIYAIYQLKQILLTMYEEDGPFTMENTIRLKRLGWLIVGYALLSDLIVLLAMLVFSTHTFSISYEVINFTALIIGAVLLILAHVFQYGSFLQHEYDTTV